MNFSCFWSFTDIRIRFFKDTGSRERMFLPACWNWMLMWLIIFKTLDFYHMAATRCVWARGRGAGSLLRFKDVVGLSGGKYPVWWRSSLLSGFKGQSECPENQKKVTGNENDPWWHYIVLICRVVELTCPTLKRSVYQLSSLPVILSITLFKDFLSKITLLGTKDLSLGA